MADVLKQNEMLQKEVLRLKREAALREQNEALQKEILRLKKKAAAAQRKPLIRALVVSSYPVKR